MPTVADCGVPPVAVMAAGAPALLVRLKLALVAAPDEAMTVNAPATALAVALSEATPLAFVVAVLVAALRLAPVLGAVKVTEAFGTRFPEASSTTTVRAVPNGVFTVVPWPDPAFVVAVLVTTLRLAPVLGAVKITEAFGTRFPEASSTTTVRAAANGVFTVALWPDPAVAVIVAGGPTMGVTLPEPNSTVNWL